MCAAGALASFVFRCKILEAKSFKEICCLASTRHCLAPRLRSQTVQGIPAVGGRKFLSVCFVLAYCNRRIAIFGARTIFLGFALILLQNRKSIFRRRFDRCGRLDRPRCSKTIENSLAFALNLPTKIDASRFSGLEQFS